MKKYLIAHLYQNDIKQYMWLVEMNDFGPNWLQCLLICQSYRPFQVQNCALFDLCITTDTAHEMILLTVL